MAPEKINGSRTPLHYQLALLGLDLGQHKPFVGKRVLDLCCGDGTLVKKLRELGIHAEGIDPAAPQGLDFFMCHEFCTPDQTRIPRPDNTYELVLSFQNPSFNEGFNDENLSLSCPYRQAVILQEARRMISETGRVLKKGAKAIIFSGLMDLRKNARDILDESQLTVSFVGCDPDRADAYFSWKMYAEKRDMDPKLRRYPEMYHHTVLEKK